MIYSPEQLAKSGTEHGHQMAFFCECNIRAKLSPLWYLPFAIPNGTPTDRKIGARMKAEGVKAGVPDIFIPIANYGLHGCFIEMKLPGATASAVSAEQWKWIGALKATGYGVTVAKGWEHAIAIAQSYMFPVDNTVPQLIV
jgi:hypothetical protein